MVGGLLGAHHESLRQYLYQQVTGKVGAHQTVFPGDTPCDAESTGGKTAGGRTAGDLRTDNQRAGEDSRQDERKERREERRGSILAGSSFPPRITHVC